MREVLSLYGAVLFTQVVPVSKEVRLWFAEIRLGSIAE
jgi:hypothetical protein